MSSYKRDSAGRRYYQRNSVLVFRQSDCQNCAGTGQLYTHMGRYGIDDGYFTPCAWCESNEKFDRNTK